MARLRRRNEIRVVSQAKRPHAELIAKQNERLATERPIYIASLNSLLNDPKQLLLDPAVRNVAIKFAKLPFAFIRDSCEGHFYPKEADKNPFTRVPLENVKPGQKLQFDKAYFEIELDYSPAAMHLRAALKDLGRKCRFVKALTAPGIQGIMLVAKQPPSEKIVDKKEAIEIQQRNLRAIQEFEKVVDLFVGKHGIKTNNR